jgi:hypothetical protein
MTPAAKPPVESRSEREQQSEKAEDRQPHHELMVARRAWPEKVQLHR